MRSWSVRRGIRWIFAQCCELIRHGGQLGAECGDRLDVAELLLDPGEIGESRLQVPQGRRSVEMLREALADVEGLLVVGAGGGGVAEVEGDVPVARGSMPLRTCWIAAVTVAPSTGSDSA